MAKLPAFQFYPGDWMKDPAVRSLSPAARGLWIDMLCLMHESDRRGYLQHATGKPVTAEQLARMTGCSTDEVSRLLQELKDSGVFSCTEHGTIYSRRIVRDEAKREKCREAGSRGGNPTLKGQSKGGSKGVAKGRSKRNPTPSSSSSSSENKSPPNPPVAIPESLDTPAFREAWDEFIRHRQAMRKPMTDQAQRMMLKKLAPHGASVAVEAVQDSIANGWQGVFPEKHARDEGSGLATGRVVPTDEEIDAVIGGGT